MDYRDLEFTPDEIEELRQALATDVGCAPSNWSNEEIKSMALTTLHALHTLEKIERAQRQRQIWQVNKGDVDRLYL